MIVDREIIQGVARLRGCSVPRAMPHSLSTAHLTLLDVLTHCLVNPSIETLGTIIWPPKIATFRVGKGENTHLHH